MNIICAPSGIVDRDRPGQGITDIAGAGFGDVLLDLAMYCPSGELEKNGGTGLFFNQGNGREGLPGVHEKNGGNGPGAMLEKCKATGLKASVCAVPWLPRDTRRTDLNGWLEQLALESIQLCRTAGSRYLIVRPLFAGVARGEEWDVNRGYYLRLAEAARECHVMILLENQCRSMNGHLIRGICADAEEAAGWVDRLNEEAGGECFGFCMDMGAYSLCGQDMRHAAACLGKRVRAVILRDWGGQEENAMLPFTGVGRGRSKTDWLGLIRGLREIDFDGEMILDLADTAASFSPILRPELMRLARAVGEYIAWQARIESRLKKYKSVVLFGAGNMCRNYMKCYGEKYPPLFACDNNPAVWGTDICGLEVKPPESLRELPEDCVILICNIYYREIETQLKEMGLRNRVEFFNDEYMHFFSPVKG